MDAIFLPMLENSSGCVNGFDPGQSMFSRDPGLPIVQLGPSNGIEPASSDDKETGPKILGKI